jgi:hypothetical protein
LAADGVGDALVGKSGGGVRDVSLFGCHPYAMTIDSGAPPELAFYYGDLVWVEGVSDWIKSLLLFFDGVAIAAPDKVAEQFIYSDPVLAASLAERGLLTNFEPDRWIRPAVSDPEAKDALWHFVRERRRAPGAGAFFVADEADANKYMRRGHVVFASNPG